MYRALVTMLEIFQSECKVVLRRWDFSQNFFFFWFLSWEGGSTHEIKIKTWFLSWEGGSTHEIKIKTSIIADFFISTFFSGEVLHISWWKIGGSQGEIAYIITYFHSHINSHLLKKGTLRDRPKCLNCQMRKSKRIGERCSADNNMTVFYI